MIGKILNQRYRINSELGRGGMGVVYRAHDELLDRDVAVKVVSSEVLGTEGRERLMHEARAVAKLNHPNIAAVHDAGQHDGAAFIVMELVNGKSLHEARPESFEAIVSLALQICDALANVHSHGIVHRDLKPENVLVETDGTCKLVDFGIARSMTSRLTAAGEIIGTAFYLAPELALKQEIDGRTDLYALGVILYELVTGELPFQHADPLQVISQHLHTSAIAPRLKNPQVPPMLEALILQLMSKNRDHRPGTAEEVLYRLRLEDILQIELKADQELQVLDRIARGRFVGREHDLALAKGVWNNALLGSGQILLVSGEAGIGKTRLTRELATYAEVTGGVVLAGNCSVDGVAPYSPFAHIIREGLRLTAEKGLNIPDAVLADLLSLVPELQASYPQIQPNPQLEPASEQQRLFGSVEEYICSFSHITPLLLIIEDVHWADSASLSLLRHLARTLGSHRICLLPSHREIELDPGGPLQQMLQDFTRERIATHLELARLTLAETGALLEVILQGQTSPGFLEGIFRHTEGNPFFVEEVCKALVQKGRLYYEDGRWQHPSMDELQIPQSVRIAIESQLAKLPQTAKQVLLLAAILGREFDIEILVKASAQGEDALIEALAAAERAHLIADVSSNGRIRYAFVHVLIPSTLREGMPALQQRRMQRAAAEAIESLHPEEYEELARLYGQSGEKHKALDFHTKAGERAYRLYAVQEAIEQFTEALELAKLVSASDEDLSHLYQRLGRAYEISGQLDKALTVYIDEESRGRESGLPMLEMSGLLSQVTVLSIPSAKWDPVRAEELANKALKLARKLKDHRAESKAYWNLMFIENYLERDLDAAVRYGEQSLAIARKHELPSEQAYALHDLAPVYCQLGEANKALIAWDESRHLWRQMGDKAMLADNLTSAASVLAYGGDVDQAQAFAEEALDFSRAIHNLWGQSYSLHMLGWLLLHLGDMRRAIAMLEESHPIAHKVEFISAANSAISILANAFRWFGQADRASELVEHALANSDEGAPYRALPLRFSAVLQADQGEKAAAIHTLHQAQEMGLQARAEPMVVAFSTQMEIEVMLTLGEYGSALRLVETLMSHLRRTQIQLLEPQALLKRAQSLRGLGRVDEARRALSTGLSEAQRLGLPIAQMDLSIERFELESQAGNASEAESVRRAAGVAVGNIADQIGEGSLRDGMLNLPRVRAVMFT